MARDQDRHDEHHHQHRRHPHRSPTPRLDYGAATPFTSNKTLTKEKHGQFVGTGTYTTAAGVSRRPDHPRNEGRDGQRRQRRLQQLHHRHHQRPAPGRRRLRLRDGQTPRPRPRRQADGDRDHPLHHQQQVTLSPTTHPHARPDLVPAGVFFGTSDAPSMNETRRRTVQRADTSVSALLWWTP